MQANTIKSITIDRLWGRKNVRWILNPHVNVLSGINGIGKSTTINLLATYLNTPLTERSGKRLQVEFDPKEANSIRFDVIRSFDRPLASGELLHTLSDNEVRTELDLQLYDLQRRYLDYQVNIGNRTIALLQSPAQEDHHKAATLGAQKQLFQNRIDQLFADTNKNIDRESNDIKFYQHNEPLTPYKLSSGEKQILVILLTALVQDLQPCALLMDEPEISLHVEWQQQLISLIRELNPQAQIILTTHSPAVIMNGWLDSVTEISDISEPI